jgi:hypothetical protein
MANNDGVMTAAESPWFLAKGENLPVREVSVRFLLLALLEDQGQTNRCSANSSFQLEKLGLKNHAYMY